MKIGIANAQSLDNIYQIIQNYTNYEIIWTANNGVEALQQCILRTPDLVIIDLIMPIMDGVEATQQIMRHAPCAVLIIAPTVKEHSANVFKAMGYGALDAVDEPSLSSETLLDQQTRETFLKKLRTLAKWHGLPTTPKKPVDTFSLNKLKNNLQNFPVYRTNPLLPKLVVIGSSTGGPKALAKILACLSPALKASVVIIQHVDAEFSISLARWLDAQVPMDVQLAIAGDSPKAGNIYVASTNDHLVLTRSAKFIYTKDPEYIPYRPSVDVFFKSVAQCWASPCIAVLLTGMGKDGAEGLATLRQAGWHTIAQDEASSTVYGMPKAAKELGAATEILSLNCIGDHISKLLERNETTSVVKGES